jgi:hypothetical protein
MDRHLAPPISGSWSPGAARAVDGASLLHGPLRVDRNAETEKKLNGWTKGRGTKRQGSLSIWFCSMVHSVEYVSMLWATVTNLVLCYGQQLRIGALTFSPLAFRSSDNLTQAQFPHGPPPGSANKRFVVAGGDPGR